MHHDLERRLREALAAHRLPRVDVDGARPAAVLVPVYPAPEPTLILTVRADGLPTHRGQISFPGGKIDPDDPDTHHAALREAQEEIGLDPGLVTIVGEFDTTPTFVSGYVVTPVVGVLGSRPTLRRNPAEVAEILEVPLQDLAEEIRREPGFEHGGRTYPTEAWVWGDHVIWGVTARLLRVFLEILAEAGLTSRPGATTSWDFPPPAP